MRSRARVLGGWFAALALFVFPARGAEWFVATNGSDAATGTNWATAKLTIQAGVDAAGSGDTVWVSNGVYATGGRVAIGTWTNRVAMDKPVTVRSANGPETSFIVGAGWRCAYVTNGAVLSGFTLTNGATAVAMGLFDTNMDHDGGGALCESSGMLTNCILADNWASDGGGGASGGILNNCTLSGNYSWNLGGGAEGGTLNCCILSGNRADMWGGGAYNSTLTECTVIGNRAASGGGAWYSTLNDCVLTTNWASDSGGGAQGGTLTRCVLESNRCAGSVGGGGADSAVLYNSLLAGNQALPSSSVWDEPRGGGARNSTLINCTVVGNTAIWGGGVSGGTAINTVIYGNTATNNPNWIDGEYADCCTIPAPSGSGNITNDPQFISSGTGDYRLDRGSPCINAGDNSAAPGDTDLSGGARIAFRQVDMGAYEYNYMHVATNGSDAADAMTWATAKQTIQAAVDVATNGCTVWVSNGVYATGGRAVEGVVSNRVAIDRPITVQSVNGPEATIIRGPGILGGALMRCAYVGSNAALLGFTLTDGAAVGSGGDRDECKGGGVFIAGDGAVENCLITSNNVNWDGGGVYMEGDSRLFRCRVVGNSASASGAAGGIYSAGGGRILNCLIASNFAEAKAICGVGMELVNCTVAENTGFGGSSVQAPTSTLWNCIVYSNHVNAGLPEITGSPVVSNSCCPGLTGDGNITNDPQFVDAAAGDYRLLAVSPCIDAGDDSAVSWAEDLDGNQRIVYGAVDMGAYETQLAGAGTWFGAIINGLTGDLDCVAGDGVPNLLKYATGGSPRISDDLMLLTMPPGGMPPLEFNRNPNATDIRIIVEEADAISNGAAWRGIATNLNGSWGGASNVSESGMGNPVVCTVTDPAALASNRFLRLRVTRP